MIQIEHFGNNSFENIADIIAIHNAKKILMVTGKKSFEKSGSEEKL